MPAAPVENEPASVVPPPPLIVLFDEEEAVDRTAGPSVARIESRAIAMQRVNTLRFESADDLARFMTSATSDHSETVVSQLVDSVGRDPRDPQLRAAAPVLVGMLPALRVKRFNHADPSSNFVKVGLR
jgi:hypothetical protein